MGKATSDSLEFINLKKSRKSTWLLIGRDNIYLCGPLGTLYYKPLLLLVIQARNGCDNTSMFRIKFTLF